MRHENNREICELVQDTPLFRFVALLVIVLFLIIFFMAS